MQPHWYLRGSIRRRVAILLIGVPIAAGTADTPAADPGPATADAIRGVEADLGLVVSPASDVLCEQLSIEVGTGLVVDAVAAGSIAARAGIRRHDVLVSLDDRQLVMATQLAGLLESTGREPPLRCLAVRAGSPQTIRLPVRLPPGWGRGELPRAARPIAAARGRVGLMMRVADETLLQQDPDFHIKVTKGGETRLFVRDARGMTVYNGPIDTPEQRSLVPISVRERVERMERLLAAPATGHAQSSGAPATTTVGDVGTAATGSARPAAHEAAAVRASPERSGSRAESRQARVTSATDGAGRRPADGQPSDGERPDIEIGRLDIEPVEIR